MPGLWISQGSEHVSISKYVCCSEYARVTQGFEYASGSEVTIVMSEYTGICVNMPNSG